LGEITLDLRLVFTIPSGRLTINGLVLGLKQAAAQILATILTTLLEAIEEKAVARQIEKDPQRYRISSGYSGRRPRSRNKLPGLPHWTLSLLRFHQLLRADRSPHPSLHYSPFHLTPRY